MAKVHAIGQPVNVTEKSVIAHLRDNLPDTYTIFHNFELRYDKDIFEIDLAILAPHCVFIVDIKGTGGLVDIYGSKWYPEGRQPYHSPLALLRQQAKIIKSLICDAHPTNQGLKQLYVHAVVLMTAPNATVVDHGGFDASSITYLKKCVSYFQSKNHIPAGRSTDIRASLRYVERAIRGKAHPRSSQIIFRDWKVVERLGGDNRYIEYRAEHVLLGSRSTARVRLYKVDPYADEVIREAEKKRISNAFRSLAHMSGHSNILMVREFFETEDAGGFVLVSEDFAGEALRQHIKKPALALTHEQKYRIIQDVLTALDHAHSYMVIHRNLTPDAVLVSNSGQARLAAFDYARSGKSRSSTIAMDIVDDLDPVFQAPECYRDPSQASVSSDLFSAGLIFYELLSGEPAFTKPEQVFDQNGVFPYKPSEVKPDLPTDIDTWLQTFCQFIPTNRYANAATALAAFQDLALSSTLLSTKHLSFPEQDLGNLPEESIVGNRFVIKKRLGGGGFAVAYKVFDSYGDVVRVLKLVLHDRNSVFERLRQEYKTLVQLPKHPYIVDVVWADRLPDETPYIVFEYIDGLTVKEFVDEQALSLEDAVTIALQVAEGLEHLHQHGVYHQDIKPDNLFWTDRGVRIIDFNVARSDRDGVAVGGGTRRYIPPDLDLTYELNVTDRIDRDLYALGITLYECVTGRYPFNEPQPPLKQSAIDPYTIPSNDNLSPKLVHLMLRLIAPTRSERFTSARELLNELRGLSSLRKPRELTPTTMETTQTLPLDMTPSKPNFNPFVSYLQTLYSQSQRSNAGTRGLDAVGEVTYVATLLDDALRPAILRGDFQVVIISGNAGDGKTAFIQRLERHIEKQKAKIQRGVNGAIFEFDGRTFISNYDGSQDEESKTNDQVLLDFFHPFQGDDENKWKPKEIYLIAINEGRLIDFLTDHEETFSRLATIVREGLRGNMQMNSVAVINLNLRSVVADIQEKNDSIFDRLLRRMIDEQFWETCTNCDLKTRCYIHHNARTFMDPIAGPRVIERLKMLYTITHLRGRLHITLRDLRSSLAFMLVGTRDCDSVHELYRTNNINAQQHILDGFYFNAWRGGTQRSEDRLISLLSEIDMGETSNPELDRTLHFLPPATLDMGRFTFGDQRRYDDDLLTKIFQDLQRSLTKSAEIPNHLADHQHYVATLRRRHYFERRDDRWRDMLPYRSAQRFLNLVTGTDELHKELEQLLGAINRGEGLNDPARLSGQLALRVHKVEGGTIRSYRLFESSRFSLLRPSIGKSAQFIEYLPPMLLLNYVLPSGDRATLNLNLDVYEMLIRLDNGYRPNAEELQGLYRSLIAFKNILSSAPYQEVLLTETGYEFHRIRRDANGILSLEQVEQVSHP